MVFVPSNDGLQPMKTIKTKIRCPECGSSLQEQVADITSTRKGESFVVSVDALVCPKCDFKTVPRDKASQFAKRTADAYRKKHDLLTTMNLMDMRATLCMTQKQFYDLVGVGEASGKRWELGEIQSKAMDKLIRFAFAERQQKGGQGKYLPWGGFEQLQDKLAVQIYDKHKRPSPGMPHGPPLNKTGSKLWVPKDSVTRNDNFTRTKGHRSGSGVNLQKRTQACAPSSLFGRASGRRRSASISFWVGPFSQHHRKHH